MNWKRIEQLIREHNTIIDFGLIPVRTEPNTIVELNQPFARTSQCISTNVNNNIMRRSEDRRKLSRQSIKHARRKVTATCTTLDDGPGVRSSKLFVQPRKVTRKSRPKKDATLRTSAIVACPAPTFAI